MVQAFYLTSQDLLVSLKFQKSWNLIGWDQNLAYLFLEIKEFQNICNLIDQENFGL